MSYLVLARKYRPQTFDQVIKQDHITRTLTNAILSGRVAHAILFSGPRGTGKTTVARILAKSMNCEKGPTPAPCNVCRSCREITTGSAADVFEIDGASNNSVDQIRELRENIKYMPAHSLYKIYIIDEVHMLSIAAFNALLKTLEEPPPHIMFIFATTEPHKIPVTILSRCQRHDFNRIGIESIAGHMATICAKEGADIATDSLRMIANEAGGSMRDALSLLDQVISCAKGTMTRESVLDILGIIDRKFIFDISGAVLRGDVPRVLEVLDEIYSRGHEIRKLYADLIEHFRNLLVVSMGKKIDKLIDLPAHEIELMQDQVKDIPTVFLKQIVNILFREEATIRFSSHPKLALEIILIQMLHVKPALPIDELIEKINDLQKNISKIRPGYSDQEDKPALEYNTIDLQETENEVKDSTISTEYVADQTFDQEEDIESIWKKLNDVISESQPSLAANLTKGVLKKLTEKSLEIEINGNAFNVKMIQREKNLSILKKICSDFFGRKMDIIITAKKKPDIKNSLDSRLKQAALDHPLVSDAIEIFNGEVIDVKIL